MSVQEQYRLLPSVDELVTSLSNLEDRFPRALIVDECRRALASAREQISAGLPAPHGLASRVKAALEAIAKPSLRRVINATGVILHTNLGRAPLPEFEPPRGYSNLEYDLVAGGRGKRDTHLLPLFERLLGVPAILVNNGAAAVWLVLHELAAGGEVIVSRGELIEIGDGFRIPDIMTRSGARLVEVGTTNKTHLNDYREALTENTCLILRVHPSNFRIEGFTGRPSVAELKTIGPLVYEDLGSGSMVDLRPSGIHEPTVQDSLRAGADIVTFSGDKLLGGPQAGVIAGHPELVQRIRRNPMFRALRVDKLTILAMETALRRLLLEEWDELPVFRMVRMEADEIRRRAERCAAMIPGATVVPGRSLLGGGSTPMESLPTFLMTLPREPVALEQQLREAQPPILARIEDGRVVVDLRTVGLEEEGELVEVLRHLTSRA